MSHIRLSANISMLFREHAFADRIRAASDAGFAAVECQFPYEVPPERLASALARTGLPFISLNTPAGATFGSAAVPGLEAQFRLEFDLALHYARSLGAGAIHVMSGITAGEPAAARETFLANLRWAAMRAGPSIRLLIEPLNSRDRPGYFVSRSDAAVELIECAGAASLGLMFDLYHIQIMEGDLISRLDRHWSHIGHVQIASVPNRREPDEVEIAFAAIFEILSGRGYAGFVGAEYNPRGDTLAGLDWARPWLMS